MLPVIFESGFISIKTYWIFTLAALLVSSYLAVNRLKRQRVEFLLLIKKSSSYVLLPLVFSRLVFFFLNTDSYIPRIDIRTLLNFISIWDQGFSIWGAIIAFFVLLTARLIKAQENIWKWYDAFMVPVLVGLGIVNLGQFLGGNAYGTPTNLPWAIHYELDYVTYTVPIHPTQLYSLAFILLVMWSKKTIGSKTDFFKVEGNSSLYFATLTSFGFFLLEFLRGDDTITLLNVRLDAYLFCLFGLISGYILFHRYKQFKHPVHESTETPQS